MSTIKKIVTLIREEGIREFARSISWQVRSRLALLRLTVVLARFRDQVTFSVDEIEASFIADDPASIARTQNRLRSEGDMLRDLLDELEEDDVFYDVGANTGLYTCFAAKKIPRGTVVAFEPYPPNIDELERNAALNSENITVLGVALADESDTVKISTPETPTPGHGTASMTADGGADIRAVRGDELVTDGTVPAPTVVKIDVEGAEPLVIDGLAESLSDSRCRLVYCEVHLPSSAPRGSIHSHGVDTSEMVVRLEGMGYSVERYEEGGDRFVLKARQES